MMRILKAFLVAAIGLFIVMFLLSLLIPSNIPVSRTTLINETTPAEVMQQVGNLHNWKNWHPAFTSPQASLTFKESKKGSGIFCELAYNGKIARIQLLSTDSSSVKFILSAPGENDIVNEIRILPIPNQQNVQVEWQSTARLKWYPWEKFYGIFIDKLTGPGYENALAALKKLIESS